MALYRATSLAEGIVVPEFYISDIGIVENLDPNVRITMCAPGEVGGTRLLIPQVAIVRPWATLKDAWRVIRVHVPEDVYAGLVRHH